MAHALTAARPADNLLGQLSHVAGQQGLPDLSRRLEELHRFVAGDLAAFEVEMSSLPAGSTRIQRAAHHLLSLRGKHLRPMCVMLASRLGGGFDARARKLALAVELVHNATLLHDDVVDLAETRRGLSTARVTYGNAASIFAGDWLLIQALKNIRGASMLDLLDRMLEIIDRMVLAESIQLENRNRINTSIDDYFGVVEGKTASLFSWAMLAGGRAGGLEPEACDALEQFGAHLGVAFQAIDDLLDLDGDVQETGKDLFVDLRDGKMTYPLILACQRHPDLIPLVEECASLAPDAPLPPAATREIATVLDRSGALEECRELAQERSHLAIRSLQAFPDGPARRALITVAEATIHRNK